MSLNRKTSLPFYAAGSAHPSLLRSERHPAAARGQRDPVIPLHDTISALESSSSGASESDRGGAAQSAREHRGVRRVHVQRTSTSAAGTNGQKRRVVPASANCSVNVVA